MWFIISISLTFINICLSQDLSSNYFCADLNPQPHIIIDQLMGMWYGIEIMSHKDERHYERIIPSCPIIHISEDTSYSTTYNPLHRDYNYGYNYGEGHGYKNPRTGHLERNYGEQDEEYYRRQQNYLRTSTDLPHYYPTRPIGHNEYMRRQMEMRRLRLWWDENGSSTEYHLRYNVSKPGFWISSGPQNGSYLQPQFSHFAGTVQVIKAVGNHLVLTFCHQLPDKQLYSVLLSRETKLDQVEVHGVHSLLNRKGLSTHAIKKVCNGCAIVSLSFSLVILSVIVFFYNRPGM